MKTKMILVILAFFIFSFATGNLCVFSQVEPEEVLVSKTEEEKMAAKEEAREKEAAKSLETITGRPILTKVDLERERRLALSEHIEKRMKGTLPTEEERYRRKTKEAIKKGDVFVGMQRADVAKSMGAPHEVRRVSTGKGYIEMWSYGNVQTQQTGYLASYQDDNTWGYGAPGVPGLAFETEDFRERQRVYFSDGKVSRIENK